MGWREALGAPACGFPLGTSAGCVSVRVPGLLGSLACFPELKLGSRTSPFHPRAELGSAESLPCLQHMAWVLSTSPPREWPSS